MAWTGTIDSITNDDTQVRVTFTFTDGTTIHKVSDRGFSTDAEIKNYMRNQLAAYENIQAINLQPGASFTLADLTPQPPAPTADQLYAQAKLKVLSLKQELDAKLIDQAAYDKAVADTLAVKPSANAQDPIIP